MMEKIFIIVIVLIAVIALIYLMIRQIKHAGQGGGCASCGSKTTCTAYLTNKNPDAESECNKKTRPEADKSAEETDNQKD